jgi:CBS domain-containing protein
MKVKQVMHKGATWVEAKTPIKKIAKMMAKLDIGAVPVGEKDRLVGMVTDRDICCRALGNSGKADKLTARDVMTGPILYCQEDQDVQSAIRLMKKGKIRRLPVISAKKRLVGMLSLGDISAKVGATASAGTLKAVAAHHA